MESLTSPIQKDFIWIHVDNIYDKCLNITYYEFFTVSPSLPTREDMLVLLQ